MIKKAKHLKSSAWTLAGIWFGLCASSCSFQIPRADISAASEYDFSLKEVRVPAECRSKYGEGRIDRADTAGIQRHVFENEMIRIFWIPTDMFLAFTLQNKTDDTLKVMWGGASYVDETGTRDSATHGGVNYVDALYRNRPKQPSVVLSNSSVTDWVIPEHCVRRAGGFMAGTGFVDPMFPGDSTLYVGKTVKVMLPLKAGETIIEYTFVFNINGLAKGE